MCILFVMSSSDAIVLAYLRRYVSFESRFRIHSRLVHYMQLATLLRKQKVQLDVTMKYNDTMNEWMYVYKMP